MRFCTIVILCLCLVLTGCIGKSGGDKPTPEQESVADGRDMPDAKNQGSERTGESEQEVLREVNVDDLGPFQKGLSLDEMKFDEKYQDIIVLFHKNLSAWAAKDKKAFKECFISEVVADSHMFFLEDPVDYEFVGTPYIDDQSSENGRINIIFSYRTSNQADEIKGNTITFIKDEDNVWKIALID